MDPRERGAPLEFRCCDSHSSHLLANNLPIYYLYVYFASPQGKQQHRRLSVCFAVYRPATPVAAATLVLPFEASVALFE